jgi:hypothetical protein
VAVRRRRVSRLLLCGHAFFACARTGEREAHARPACPEPLARPACPEPLARTHLTSSPRTQHPRLPSLWIAHSFTRTCQRHAWRAGSARVQDRRLHVVDTHNIHARRWHEHCRLLIWHCSSRSNRGKGALASTCQRRASQLKKLARRACPHRSMRSNSSACCCCSTRVRQTHQTALARALPLVVSTATSLTVNVPLVYPCSFETCVSTLSRARASTATMRKSCATINHSATNRTRELLNRDLVAFVFGFPRASFRDAFSCIGF